MTRAWFSRTAIFLTAVATATASSVISVQPSTLSVTTGQIFSLDIDVNTIADLYAWQFDVNFDPLVLSALSVNEGAFLAQGGPTFFIQGAIDNTGGAITSNADTLEGAIPGVTGGGHLASIQFQALASGSTTIVPSNLDLLDSNLNLIDEGTADGTVIITPEHSNLMLSFAGLMMLGLGKWALRQAHRTDHASRWRTISMLAILGIAIPAAHTADITTAQIDAARTMANGSEIYLTTSNVNASHFGKLFTLAVDGAIFAQPLYLQGVVVLGKKINAVYVVTSHDNVYAYNADSPNTAPIWSVNLGTYDTPSGWNTGLGILATPLIVRSLNAIYVVSATVQGGSRVYTLHALDLVNGAEKFNGPVAISGSVPGTAGDSVNGLISFAAQYHIQRTSLALSGNNVILAFSADRDHAPYHGWIFSYNASTLQQNGVFNDTLSSPSDNGAGAGIWQSGRAPAIDSNGSVYFETGNGTWDGTSDFGESFLKLTQGVNGLSLADWFTPNSWNALNAVDYDLSSTGPTLITGTNLLFGGAKSGTIYLLSTANLGQITTSDTGVVQEFVATSGCAIPFVGQGCAQIMGHAFWPTAPSPTLYVWGVHDFLRSYQFSGGLFNTVAGSVGSVQANYPGGVLSLSSYLGTAGTGILWAITCDTPDEGFYFGPGFSGTATLHAFDAANPANELWNSGQNASRDSVGTLASFAPPVAVNGKVYVPTFSNQLVVYGLLTGPVPGDVNGDTVVNCIDLSIVKAAYGKSTGQVGFDLRADVNGDGVVNILDLATVSRNLPTGTVCH